MFVGGGRILAFYILLHNKSLQKNIGNQFCTSIIFKNPLNTGNIHITINVGCVIGYWYKKLLYLHSSIISWCLQLFKIFFFKACV